MKIKTQTFYIPAGKYLVQTQNVNIHKTLSMNWCNYEFCHLNDFILVHIVMKPAANIYRMVP